MRKLIRNQPEHLPASFKDTVNKFDAKLTTSNTIYFLCDRSIWSESMGFKDFVGSIFYIGIGTHLRPFDHFIYAHQKELLKDQFKHNLFSYYKPLKEDKILSIWRQAVHTESTNEVMVVRMEVKSQDFAKFCEYATLTNFQSKFLIFKKYLNCLILVKTGLTNKKLDGRSSIPVGMNKDEVVEFGAQFILETYKQVLKVNKKQFTPTYSHLNVMLISVKESDYNAFGWMVSKIFM